MHCSTIKRVRVVAKLDRRVQGKAALSTRPLKIHSSYSLFGIGSLLVVQQSRLLQEYIDRKHLCMRLHYCGGVARLIFPQLSCTGIYLLVVCCVSIAVDLFVILVRTFVRTWRLLAASSWTPDVERRWGRSFFLLPSLLCGNADLLSRESSFKDV